MEFDPYAILGVAHDCGADELKSAYRRMARENHPDIAPDKPAATLRMTQINAAWAQVGDPQKRAAFDARWRLDERERQRVAATIFERERSARSSKSPSSSSSRKPTKAAHTPAPAKPTAPTNRATKPQSAPSSSSGGAKTVSKRPSSATSASRHARLAEASRLLFKQNKPNEALELCKFILKTDFRNIPARELMGEAYLRLGQTDRALAVWEQALVLSPANVTLRRRWLSLMPPEARAAHERKRAHVPQGVPRAVPLDNNSARPGSNPQPATNLLSRLVSRLKKK